MASSSSFPPDDLHVDDFYFSVLSDTDEIFPISDEKYAEGLQLQETLMSSQLPQDDETLISSASSTQLPLAYSENDISIGESSKSERVFCSICMDSKERREMFNKNKCGHLFCLDCVSKHIGVKIQQNPKFITCPDVDCNLVFEPEDCRFLIPDNVFDRWMDALCESFILGSQKFYCPYKDCSAMLVDDGNVLVMESECPHCRRLFCAQCKVSWHSDISCEDFQKLNEHERGRDDRMVMELAKQKKWGRCPSCKFYVEKKDGCQHITCRCGFQFCYGCGITWGSHHGGCQRV
ncbi:RBR-type E3 ubiquitin transferase [Ranunculus cassubicifolius]